MNRLVHLIGLAALVWLLLVWAGGRLRTDGWPRAVNLALGIAAALLLLVPVEGLRLHSWIAGFCPTASLPLLGVVAAGLWRRLGGAALLAPADWTAVWWFGAAAGTALYLHPMVFGSVDLYYWGWGRASAAWGLAGLAAVFLAAGNRLGVLLLAALAGYAGLTLESANGWDYVVDPIYWLASLGVLGRRAVRGLVARLRPPAIAAASGLAPAQP